MCVCVCVCVHASHGECVCAGYVTTVLEDAKVYSEHAQKKEVDVSDVKLAVETRVDHSFTSPPPKEVRAVCFPLLSTPSRWKCAWFKALVHCFLVCGSPSSSVCQWLLVLLALCDSQLPVTTNMTMVPKHAQCW